MKDEITEMLDKMGHEELMQFADWYAKELRKEFTKATEPPKADASDDAFMRQSLTIKGERS